MRLLTGVFAAVISVACSPLYANSYFYTSENPNVFGAQGKVVGVSRIVDNQTRNLVKQTVTIEVAGNEHAISCHQNATLRDQNNNSVPGDACPVTLLTPCSSHTQTAIGSTSMRDPNNENNLLDVTVVSIRCTDGWRGECLLASGHMGIGTFGLENPHTIPIGTQFWLRPYSYCD